MFIYFLVAIRLHRTVIRLSTPTNILLTCISMLFNIFFKEKSKSGNQKCNENGGKISLV